jgi:hypothetical protein
MRQSTCMGKAFWKYGIALMRKEFGEVVAPYGAEGPTGVERISN